MPRKRASKKTVSRRVFGHFSERPKNPLRVGLYAHGSTHDQQTLPLQRRAMRDYVGRRGWTIAADIKEVGSGASVRELRQKLLEAARRRDIDVVVVWRLERSGRSLTDLVTTLQELGDLEVAGHVFGPREFKRCSVLTLRRLSYRKRRFSPSVSAYIFDVGLPYALLVGLADPPP